MAIQKWMRHNCINFTVSHGIGVFFRFRRAFAEVIAFDKASSHEFQPNFLVPAFKIGVFRSCAIDIMATSSIVSDNEA